jgi:hypothetical protein
MNYFSLLPQHVSRNYKLAWIVLSSQLVSWEIKSVVDFEVKELRGFYCTV